MFIKTKEGHLVQTVESFQRQKPWWEKGIAASVLILCMYQIWSVPPSLKIAAIAYVIGDAYVGILHRFLDDPKTQCLPPFLPACAGFLAHHDSPQQTSVDVGPWSLIVSGIKMHLLVIVFHFICAPSPFSHRSLTALSCFLLVAGFQQGISHVCAHRAKNSRIVRVLQSCHLILPSWMHREHHRPPHATRFAIPNGISNYVLDPWLGKIPWWAVASLLFTLTCTFSRIILA